MESGLPMPHNKNDLPAQSRAGSKIQVQSSANNTPRLATMSLPMPGKILVGQIPVLPKLQGRQQDHNATKAGVPESERAVA